MVTLQILVLSFLVRIRVSQPKQSIFQSRKMLFYSKVTLGYGVMVTLQILVLSFLVRIRVSQQNRASFKQKDAFLLYSQNE